MPTLGIDIETYSEVDLPKGYTPMRNIQALRSSSSPMPSMMRKHRS